MQRLAALLLILATVSLSAGAPAFAHEHWINAGGYVSPIDGSTCCGEQDCFMLPKEQMRHIAGGDDGSAGYVWRHPVAAYTDDTVEEFIPDREVKPSRDGEYWRCKRPDGSRRCFFAPPPSM